MADQDLYVGNVGAKADGALAKGRAGKTNEMIVGSAHGDYYESALRKNLFYAASQAATTWSVALNTTHTGFVVSNPVGSPVNLSILQASFALSVAPVAISHIGVFGGFLAAGIATHTTPLTPASTFLGNLKAYGLADAAATLVGTPAWLLPLMSGFTAGALFATTPAVVDIKGSIVVPPGGYVGIAALTAVVGFAGMIWEEIPIS